MSSSSRPSKKRRISIEPTGDGYETNSNNNSNTIPHDEQSRENLASRHTHHTIENLGRRNSTNPNGSDSKDATETRKVVLDQRTSSKPTHVRDAANASQLYGSNSLKLQLDDLLHEDRMKSTNIDAHIKDVLGKLKGLIEAIPEAEPMPIIDAEKLLSKAHKVVIPFPNPRPTRDSNYKLQFIKPSHVNVIGSYPLRLISKPRQELHVDMLVTMPPTMFQEKDYLDYRYFYRRAYYVARIAAAIKASGEDFQVSYDYLDGNYLQPVVLAVVSPATIPSSKRIVISIIPGLPEGTFPAKRTLPTKASIRHSDTSETEPVSESHNIPTPFYNGSIRTDALFTSYLKLFSTSLKLCDGFKDACTLGRIWLRRRGLASNVHGGGFGNFELACLIALLLENNSTGKGLLSSGYSSYQLFKATLQFLATKDLARVGYSTLPSAVYLPLPADLPCFYDAERSHNVLYKMTPWSYAALRQEAKTTTDALANSARDPFEATFLATISQPALQFDLAVEIEVSHVTSQLGMPLLALGGLQKLYDILQKALTDRIRSIHFQLAKLNSWSLVSAPPSTNPVGVLVIGLIVDPAQASRAMDRGPSMDNKSDVKAYLNFWGHEKAVRMKFGNESPIETVTWETSGRGPSVLEQIIAHVLRRHMGKEVTEAARIVADPFASHIKDVSRPLSHGAGQRASLSNAFTTFERDLRSMDGLPLQIRHVLPASSTLRYSNLSSNSNGSNLTALDVNVQFEGSGRWPDDLAAIQRTKIAFLLKLKDIYESSHDGILSHVRLENQQDSILNQAYLDVTYTASQLVFRIRIHHERELALLESRLKDRSTSSIQKERFAGALAKYRRDFIHRPAHTQALQTLCTRLPVLSPAIKLTKAWFAAHLLLDDEHVSEELVELMVVRTFTTPWPWEMPGSASTAFARTIHWLAQWDWKIEPLIVDLCTTNASAITPDVASLHTNLRTADLSAIATQFDAWRRIDPMLNRVVLFAASSLDRDGTTWTDQNRPAKVVAARMTTLAQAASKVLETGDMSTHPEALFTPNLEDFDFVLHLNASLVRGRSQYARTGTFKNLELQGITNTVAEMANYDPIGTFIRELRELYGDAVVLFHDQREDNVLAGLWNPTMNERNWKVKMPISTIPMVGGPVAISASSTVGVNDKSGRSDETNLVRMNKSAIIREIARIGGDVVDSIDVNAPL